MKDHKGSLLWGFVLIGFGVIVALESIFGYKIDLFFDGWWTLFIIIPSLKNILYKEAGFMSFVFFGGGVILLLEEQTLLEQVSISTLIVSIVFFSIGFSMLLGKGNVKNKKKVVKHKENTVVTGDPVTSNAPVVSDVFYTSGPISEYEEQLTEEFQRLQREKQMESSGTFKHESLTNTEKKKTYTEKKKDSISAILGSNLRQYMLEEFHRCNIISILGNVQVDIRNARIEGDIFMDVTCILGGIDIYVPSNIRIVNQTTTILSEVESKIKEPNDLSKEFYTLYVRGACVLGGIEIK